MFQLSLPNVLSFWHIYLFFPIIISFRSLFFMSPMFIIIMQQPSLSLYLQEGMTTFFFFLKTQPTTKHTIPVLIEDRNGYT